MLPKDISKYSLSRVLGNGGFATVYYATCPNYSPSHVAIKLLKKSHIKASHLAKRVAHEVEIHWRLKHDSICELFTYFEDSENVYLIQELCENGELFQYVQARKSLRKSFNEPLLSEPEARKIIVQIVLGVKYLHSNNVMHRDLKLSNILLTSNFDIKIADFGLAVILGPKSEQHTMCGTPNYISPEVISRTPYGLASDIWAIGCILITLLTGVPPFDSDAVKSTLDKVCRGQYELPDYISHESRDLINKLLEKDPTKRLPIQKILGHPWFKGNVSNLLRIGNDVSISHANISHFGVPNSGINNANPSLMNIQNYSEYQKAAALSKLPISSYKPQSRFIATPIPTVPQKSIQNPNIGNSIISTPAFEARSDNFSTARLKPLTQKTKHGVISITDTGRILLDFTMEKQVISISPDSRILNLHNRVSLEVEREYSVSSSLPIQLVKIFNYASKFVALVQSKTPKVTLVHGQVKYILMEPGGHKSNFEYISDSRKCVISYYKQIVTFTSNAGEKIEFQITKINDDEYSKEFIMIEKAREKCLEVECEAGYFPITRRFDEDGASTCVQTKKGTPSLATPSSYSVATSKKSRGHKQRKECFLETIGWCIQGTDGIVVMLFNDGEKMVVDPKDSTLAWGNQDIKYRIDKLLPAEIKSKLKFFPKFMDALRNQ